MAGNTGFDEENNMENHTGNPGNTRGAGNGTPSHVSEIEDKAGVVHPVHAKQLEEERTVTFTGDATGTASWKFGAPANPGEASETVELTVRDASSSQSGLMSSNDFTKLAALPGNSALEEMFAGKKDKQAAIDTDPAADGSGITFVDSVHQDTQGVITEHRKTVRVAESASGANPATSGLISGTDKDKLDHVSPGATKVAASNVNGNILIDGTETNVYTHATDGANGSAGDTQNQTPKFGETFKVVSATVDREGHTTALGEHTVKIPDTAATKTVAGLMGAEDKVKLDGIESGAEVNQYAYGSVKVGNAVVSAAGKTDTLELVQGSGVTLAADTANRKVTISSSASPGDSSPSAVSSSASAGVSGDFSRADHVHNIVVAEGSTPGTVKVAGQDAAVKGWDTKADMVAGATENDFAAFDSHGNIKDSGHKHSDYKTVQQAVSDPASGGTSTGIAFISGISQDTNGVITPVKKEIRGATTSQSGVVELAGSIGAAVSSENNKAATEKAVRDAINALDVASVGGEGKYIGEISEADGKISATAETADSTPTANSKKLITSGGVKAAIDALDVTDTAVAHKFVTAVSETDGKVGVTRAQPTVSDVDGLQNALDAKQDSMVFDGTYDSTDNKAATVSSVTSRINDLDSDATSVDGTHVQVKVTQTDGKITAVNITSDTTETTSNKASSINSSNPSVVEYPTSAAVADFVNSSISTNTATFRGTLSLSDLGLTYPATEQQIVAALNAHTWPSGVTITNNDYVNVTVNNPATADVDTYKRFKYSAGSPGTWKWEFDINNTTFTQAQMDAINSGATSTKITGYDAHVSDKANPHEVTKTQVGLGNVANTGDSDIPVSGGTTKFTTGGAFTELNKKADKTSTVTGVAWDSTNSKITQTVNGTTGDVVSASTMKSAMSLDNVDNTSDATKKSNFTGSIADGNTGFVTGDDAYDALAGKQDSLASQTAYTSAGGATKVPQITTNNLGQVTGITEVTITGVAPAAHAHGNIADGGTLQTTDASVASGDKLVVTDSSDGGKVARSSIEFDGSTTSKALTPKGTFETFLQSHQDITGKADWANTVSDVKVSSDGKKIQQVKGNPGGTTATTDVAALDGTYDASTNKIATQSTVRTAVEALDAAVTSSDGTNVQVKVTEVDGKVTAVNVTTDNTEVKTHVHGSINRDGTITASAVTVGTGDSIPVIDSSDGGKVVKGSIAFDTTKPNMALTQAGTWAEFNNNPAFSKVKVGNVTVEADAAGDTIEIVAGSGITLTPDTTNDKVTVAHTNSVTAGTIGSTAATGGLTVDIPYANFDSAGHITGNGVHVHTVPDATTLAKGAVQLQDSVGSAETEDGKAVTPKAVRDAINDLDVASAGGDGKYIKSISEVDGKVVPVEGTMDSVPTAYSVNAATSGGIKDELDRKADVDDLKDITLGATYDGSLHRLTFDNIIFDNIYPVVGKYGLAVFTETADTGAVDFSGDAEWLLDWRPYLVDMTAREGEIAKTPVAELRKDNWLRKVDGSFAPVCGITATQKTALDGKATTLVFGNAADHSSSTVASTVTDAFADGVFQAANLWNYLNTSAGLAAVNTAAGTSYTCAVEVEVYDGSTTYSYGNYQDNHIPAPWETTETKYSVFIGRETDVYLVDGSEKYGEYMRGLTAKPVPVGSSQFDPEFFKLRRTGISPGPSTTKGDCIRSFFYNYPGTDSDTAGYPSANAACFKNNGTYPRTNDVSQYTAVQMARACNSGGSNGVAYPVAEGGFHALNAFLCSLEAAYGNRNLWDTSKFSTGISSNDNVKNGIWNGSSFTAWSNGTYGTANANNDYPKFQCMESQIAASLAAEMGIAENAEFNWNGGVWYYETPSLSGIKSIADGRMNCRMYKKITEGLSPAVPAGGYYMLRCALAEGVNPVGDIWAFMGGGCELVYESTGTGDTDYRYSFYLEPDQTKWITGSYVTTPHVTGSDYGNEKHTDNAKFQAETQYTAIITDSTAGGTGLGYSLSRTGYTPLRKIEGGSYTTGECAYNYRDMIDDGTGSVGIRTRRRVAFRSSANINSCSPRYLNSVNRPSYFSSPFGCAAQVLLA